jgi:hypothetical protein
MAWNKNLLSLTPSNTKTINVKFVIRKSNVLKNYSIRIRLKFQKAIRMTIGVLLRKLAARLMAK